MDAQARSHRPGLVVSLAVSGAWLVVLGSLAYLYRKGKGTIVGIDDPRGVLAIAWTGSLGALTANFGDIARRADRWNPHLVPWFIVRPVTGAAFGAFGYLIYQTVVQATVTDAPDPSRPGILGYVIAFILGYREEMFRDLLKRVTELLASAGSADVEPPSAPPGLNCVMSSPASRDVTVSWDPSSDNVAVAGYNVYRNRSFLAAVLVRGAREREPASQHERGDAAGRGRDAERLSFVDRTVEDPRAVVYSVTAFDAAGNESAPAGPIRVHVPGGPRRWVPIAGLRGSYRL